MEVHNKAATQETEKEKEEEREGEEKTGHSWGHWTSERVNVNSFEWATSRPGAEQSRCHFGVGLRILPYAARRSLGRAAA